MSAKLVTVFGATGNQGGSVCATILGDPELAKKYKVRAITRDPAKPAARALADRGAETVRADLADPASLAAAVAGSYAVFGVTDYWQLLSMDREFAQGKAIADACIAAGVKHLVWSALPETTKLTDGKLPNIDHFVAKAHVAEYVEGAKAAGGLWATHFMPGLFMSNFKDFINKGPDGAPTLAIPWHADTPLGLIDVATDTGKYVVGALEAGAAADGQWIQAVSEWTTPQALSDAFADAGTPVKFAEIPRDTFRGFLAPKMGDAVAEEMTQNMDLVRDYHYYGVGAREKQRDYDRFVVKGQKLTSFKDFYAREGPWSWS